MKNSTQRPAKNNKRGPKPPLPTSSESFEQTSENQSEMATSSPSDLPETATPERQKIDVAPLLRETVRSFDGRPLSAATAGALIGGSLAGLLATRRGRSFILSTLERAWPYLTGVH